MTTEVTLTAAEADALSWVARATGEGVSVSVFEDDVGVGWLLARSADSAFVLSPRGRVWRARPRPSDAPAADLRSGAPVYDAAARMEGAQS